MRSRHGIRLAALAAAIALLAVGCGTAHPSRKASRQPFCDSLCLIEPGDYGSANWRIPALLCLDDGTLLAACDRRKYNETDLPEDIDVVVLRSGDLGHTWTAPLTLIEGQGRGRGYGDPALVQCPDGDVLCLFAGHNGYFQSSDSLPIRVLMKRSTDRGRTWGDTVDLTRVLWDSASPYRGAFVASGNGLRLKHGPQAGRLLFAAAMLRRSAWVSDNYIIYSDDGGHSWHRSQMAFEGGDEAKLMELNNGQVLLSVRRNGARGWNLSPDGGEHWGQQGLWPEMTVNACNGDMLRLDDTTLIHSIPNSMRREDVSLFVSHDEGRTWHSPRKLTPGPSVYSSLALLPDGTVGCLVERNPKGECQLWFYRFNKAWLGLR